MLLINGEQVSGTMTDTNSVIREKRGQALWITINRPEKRNAINGDVVAGIARGYRDAHDDPDVRVIVLARAVGDKELSDDILAAGRDALGDRSAATKSKPVTPRVKRSNKSHVEKSDHD